jgi:hypothetical protein
MRVKWDVKPEGPYIFSRGVYTRKAEMSATHVQLDLTLQQAVALFAEDLPSRPQTWAYISNAREERLLARTHLEHIGEKWDGCEVVFSELLQWWNVDDVSWWATLAENFDQQMLT